MTWVSEFRQAGFHITGVSYPYLLPSSHLAPPSFSVFLVPPISVTNNSVCDYTVLLVATLGNTVATKSNNNPQK